MSTEIDPHQAIAVYQLIREHGEALDGSYRLNGVKGSTDFDGYTVFLTDDKVSLTVYFHNKYKLEFKHAHELEAFVARLKAIENSYSNSAN